MYSVYSCMCVLFYRKILDDLSSADAALHKNSSDPMSAAAAATLQAHQIQVCYLFIHMCVLLMCIYIYTIYTVYACTLYVRVHHLTLPHANI